MSDTLSPLSPPATVWIRAQIPEAIHSALLKKQAQSQVDSGERETLENTLISVLTEALLPAAKGEYSKHLEAVER